MSKLSKTEWYEEIHKLAANEYPILQPNLNGNNSLEICYLANYLPPAEAYQRFVKPGLSAFLARL